MNDPLGHPWSLRMQIVVLAIGAIGIGLAFAGLAAGHHRRLPVWDQWAIFVWAWVGPGGLTWYLVRQRRRTNNPHPQAGHQMSP
jgi:hypothetical protein